MTALTSELVLTLIEATYNYRVRLISNDTDREYYAKAMRDCYEICSNGSDLFRFHRELLRKREFTERNFRPSWSLFSNIRKAYLLGIEHNIEIVEKLLTRFETGYTDGDDKFLNNIWRKYADKGIRRLV